MSDALVTFFADGMLDRDESGQEAFFGFACPRRKGMRCEGLAIRSAPVSRPSWEWVEPRSRDAPTFSPSINCQGGCTWHGYIENGRCVDARHNDEPEPT